MILFNMEFISLVSQNFLKKSWKYHISQEFRINFVSNVKTLNILYFVIAPVIRSHFNDIPISSSPLSRGKNHRGPIEHGSRHIDFTYRQRQNVELQTKDKYWCLKINIRI